ncbi:MAG: efflux RND transporter periplasmic adaptor subunit [Gammaproteobacteria bacterium]
MRIMARACGLLLSTLPILLWAADDPFTVTVASGPFELRVIESARLDAGRSVTIASELPSNQAKLIWLAPEGSWVEAGAEIVRFDPTPFETEAQKLEREHEEAAAAQLQAEAEMQLQVQQGREDRRQLQQQIDLAELKLRSLIEADQPLRIAAARAELASAEVAWQESRQELNSQQEMLDMGLGSEGQLAQAKAMENEQRNARDLAAERSRIIREIESPSERKQAEMELVGKRKELEHAVQADQHGQAQKYAALTRIGHQVERSRQAMEKAQAFLDKTRIVAPVSGFVVYKQVSVGNERRRVQVGDSVWNRHGFMVIPDMTTMVADINVRERDIAKLAVGQAVTLWPDAFADLSLSGKVEFVGTLATESAGAGVNLFQVRILLDAVDSRLRPGMHARASVLTDSYKNVLRVPVEAVFYEKGEPVCYVWSGGRAVRQSVAIGPSDGKQIIVEKGLKDGDRVMLTDPATALARNRP